MRHNSILRAVAAAVMLAAAVPLAPDAAAETVIRHRIPNSDFPILSAAEIPPGATVVFLSGAVPPVSDAAAPAGSLQAYGDTRTQTVGTLTRIQGTLQNLRLTMGDVFKMTVFLVGDPARGGRMDFDGFMQGYRQFYGTSEQPNLPTRSVVQVAGLANAGWLVEIEVTAVRP